jgi:hypothetical protein
MPDIFGLINTIISRVWPDKTEQQRLELIAEMQKDENLTKLMTGQMEVNAAEAAHPNLFVAGWRPCVGWVCASAFAWQFVVLPILLFVSEVFGHHVPTPEFDIGTMVTVLMGMLGLGGLRTYEKIKGK